MDLDEFVSRFLDAGVFAEVVLPDMIRLGVEAGSPMQAVLGRQTFRDGILGLVTHLKSGKKDLTEDAIVRAIGSQWSFENDVFDVSINLLAVQVYRPSLDEIFSVAWDYYFREPVLIDRWCIPVYQQPRWNLESAERCIGRASSKTPEEMAEIVRVDGLATRTKPKRRRRLDGHFPEFYELLPVVDDLLYCGIAASGGNGSPFLYLRGDLQEAFVVNEMTSRLEDFTLHYGKKF